MDDPRLSVVMSQYSRNAYIDVRCTRLSLQGEEFGADVETN
jgi:hypothetical protein